MVKCVLWGRSHNPCMDTKPVNQTVALPLIADQGDINTLQ